MDATHQYVKIRGKFWSKVVSAWVNDDMSSWCAHGSDFSKPFAKVASSEKKWKVTHIRTGFTVSHKLPPLNKEEALRVCAALDAAYDGWSQVETRDTDAIVGWEGEPSRAASAVISQFNADLTKAGS